MKTNAFSALLVALCLGNLAYSQQTCYSISDGTNVLYEFDLSDGSVSGSQSLSSCSSPEASSLNLKGDTLWIMNADELHYVPVSTTLANTEVTGSNISAQQLSGSNGNLYISDFDAMSVDTANNLWAGSSSSSPCLLAVINRDGTVAEDYFGAGNDYLVVDNSNYSALRFDAMAFNPLTNELYANMNGLSQNYDYLFKIDIQTGAMTFIKQFSQMSDVEGMAFDALGDLYVTTGSSATNSSDDDKLWKVDLTTGFATEMFSLGGSDVEACDCAIGDPIPVVEISGTVFYDSDESGTYGTPDFEDHSLEVELFDDVNNNGSYDSGTDTVLKTTNTMADGSYFFKIIYTSGTERYLVRIDTTDLPSGADFFGDDVLAVTVTEGSVMIEENDFGYESDIINAFEGFTYGDSDNDQTFDSWESPISGVRVRLFEDDNCNGAINTGDDQIDSTIVGADGKYVFLQNYTGGGSNQCYITAIDESTLPTSSSLTTDNIETASFTSGGGADQNNNFGIWGGAIAALPVDWLGFTASRIGDAIALDWATASEENNSHFEVQRSANGDVWETIAWEEGMGTVVSITEYSVLDREPHLGINYYRIKQVDFDGAFDYSKTIGIDLTGNLVGSVNLVPNPADQEVNLNWARKIKNPLVELTDLNGQVIKTVQLEGAVTNGQLNLWDVPRGIYLVKISSPDMELISKLAVR